MEFGTRNFRNLYKMGSPKRALVKTVMKLRVP
jgi:hypothetical protein